MPNRIIKESICTSKGLSECSVFAEELYKRLIVYADDYGRFNADTEIMLARLYPRELQYITEDDLIDALIELAGIGKIAFYTAQPRKEVYGCLPKWEEHQRVRNVKAKCPDPDDTTVNDWYMRRFISADLREKIIERDGFKCQICGKYLTTMRDAKRFAKLGGGLYHIDHIIPVFQGGRATEENLRLTCPACNQSRKKRFTMDEIIDFTLSPPVAAVCSEPPRPAAIIQSNPNPNPNPDIVTLTGYLSARTDYNEAVDAYNTLCAPTLPAVKQLSKARQGHLKTGFERLQKAGLTWTDYFTLAAQSDFLMGRNGAWHGCGFDWLIKPANMLKVIEGNYNNQTPAETDEAERKRQADLRAWRIELGEVEPDEQ